MKKHKLLRIIVPAAIVVVWLILGGIGGPYFGKISDVASNDLATFLPKNAESTKVKDQLVKFQDASTIPAVVVFDTPAPLTSDQKAAIDRASTAIQQTGLVKGKVSTPILSDDVKAEFIVVPLDSNSDFITVLDRLEKTVTDAKIGIDDKFTGPAMFSRDLQNAFAGIDGTLLFVALGVVFVILLIVYRSPVLPIVTLMGAMMALATAILVVWHLAKAGLIQLNGQVQGILFILVIGAATDYSLLYIARYREELTHHREAWDATKAAWKAAFEPILAAGGTVTLGLLCLLVSDLGSNKALGPVGGMGIVLAVVAALTFLPAILLLIGRRAFWPGKPVYRADQKVGDYVDNHPVWARVGAFVGRHPRRIWMITLGVLILAVLAIPQLKAQGVSQENLILGKSEARDGQNVLNQHFPSGSGSPAYVLVPTASQQNVVALLDKDTGVDAVSVVTNDKSKSPAPIGKSASALKQKIYDQVSVTRTHTLANLRASIESKLAGAPQAAIEQAYQNAAASIPSAQTIADQAYPFSNVSPKVADGNTLLQVTLRDAASSVEARQTIARLRSNIQSQYPQVMFGGESAIQLDTNNASEHDLRLIIPLILGAITIVLMLLLRSIIAPIVLLFTTVISFGATLGISALLFNNVWNYAGADPSVVIYGFVFLVALGIDYNIFLMTRVREETIKLGVRAGTLKALIVTGGVITGAGVVLASTFAALYVIPILFLAQIAFIVAFGVLLDTIIVRSLLVSSLTLSIGRYMWWPSKLWKSKK